MRLLSYGLRPATEEDLPQVEEIEREAIDPPWSLDCFKEELGKKHAHFWVVTDNETDQAVLAYVVFSFPAEQAHITTVAVRSQQRRQGLGTYLLRQLISFVMRKKGESVILEVRKGNQAAVAAYQKLGFVVIRTIARFYPDGEDAYVMLYKTERSKLTASGDSEDDFESDTIDGKENFN